MRLIQCKIRSIEAKIRPDLYGADYRKACIDLDKINYIYDWDNSAVIMIEGTTLETDIPYEKAVALWENYRPDKGVSTTMD